MAMWMRRALASGSRRWSKKDYDKTWADAKSRRGCMRHGGGSRSAAMIFAAANPMSGDVPCHAVSVLLELPCCCW